MSEPDCRVNRVGEVVESTSKPDTVRRPRLASSSALVTKGRNIVVEVNLRQPSMLHGKKGFERVVWAAKNVLNRSLTWLFYDRRTADDSSSGMVSITVRDTSALMLT